MDRNGIVETLGRQRRVESFVQLYAGHALDADLKDLCQIVYVILLTMDEDKLRDLWEHDEIDFFLRRIIRTQLWGHRSDYEREVLRFRRRTTEINERSHASSKTGNTYIREGDWDYFGIQDK